MCVCAKHVFMASTQERMVSSDLRRLADSQRAAAMAGQAARASHKQLQVSIQCRRCRLVSACQAARALIKQVSG